MPEGFHPIIVLFALLAGHSAYGLAGALLAIPVVHSENSSESTRPARDLSARSGVLAVPHEIRDAEASQASRPIDIERGGDE